jgi:hypothetical protein
LELVKPVDIDPFFTLKTASFFSVEGSRKYDLVDTTRAKKNYKLNSSYFYYRLRAVDAAPCVVQMAEE